MKKLYKITALALLTGLFSHSAKADTLPPDTTNQKKSPSTTLNFFPENMANAPTTSENSAPFSQPRKILNVGDSRTVGMFFPTISKNIPTPSTVPIKTAIYGLPKSVRACSGLITA